MLIIFYDDKSCKNISFYSNKLELQSLFFSA